MSSVSSMNPGLADLLQTLTNVNSPVMSSPAAVSALEKASPADIVQLSVAATQLQGIDAMFGISNSSSDGTSPDPNSLLANLEANLTGPASQASRATNPAIGSQPSASGSSAMPLAAQVASYQSALQTAETEALFGKGATGGLANSLFDVTG